MTNERLKEIVENLLDWGGDHDDEFLQCMIYASGMNKEECKEFGVDDLFLSNEEDEPVVVDNDCIFEFNIHLYGDGEKDNYKQLEHHFDYIIAEDDVMYYGIKVDDSSMEDIYVTGTSNKKFTLNLTGWDCISRYDIKFNPLVD